MGTTAIPIEAAGEKTVPAAASPERLRLSLETAMQMAAQRNIEVVVADERVRQAIERLGQAVSVVLPHLSLNSSESRQTRNLAANGISFPGQPPIVGPFNTFDARINMTQSLFDWSAVERFRAARANKRLSEAERRQAREDVLALAGTLYLEAKRAVENTRVGRIFVKRDRERTKIALEKMTLGVSTEAVYQAAIRDEAQSRHFLKQARAEAAERKLDLLAALGLPPETPVMIQKKLPVRVVYNPETTDEELKESHPEIETARQQLEQSRANRRTELAGFLPQVSGFGDYGASGRTPTDAESTYTVGAKVTLPLLEGGRKWFSVREAGSKVRESQARLEDKSRKVLSGKRSAIENLKQADELVIARETQLVYQKKELELARERLQSGLGSRLELLETEAAAVWAREQEEESVALYWNAQIQLAHAMGQMQQFTEIIQKAP